MALSVGLAVAAAQVLPFRYHVQARVLAQRSPLMATLSNPGVNRDWDAPTRAAREVLIRRDNLVALCKQTDFVRTYLEARAPAVKARDWLMRALFGRERVEAEVLEGLVDTLQDRLWVQVSPEGTVTISFEWSDKVIAYQIVQAALQSFLEARYASEIGAVGETIAILQGHDARVRAEIASTIDQVEEKERALRIRTGPRRVAVARPRGAQDEELARIQGVLSARQRALADLEEFRQRRLDELQGQLVQQQGIYAPQHPAIASTRHAIDALAAPSTQINALRSEIQELEREVSRRGGRQADAAAESAALQSIQMEMAEARLRLESEDPRLEFERRQLQLLLRQHSNLLERIDAARVEVDTAQAAFKYRYSVITPPQLPKHTVKPYALMLLMAGFAGGMVLAFGVSAVVDLRSGRLVEPWQVVRKLGVPLLARIRR